MNKRPFEILHPSQTEDGRTETEFRRRRGEVAGYRSQKKYGCGEYCPSATPHHRRAIEKNGYSPNLVWFDSVTDAVAVGYTPCGNCWLKGPLALEHWNQYLDACKSLNLSPIEPPVYIRRRLENPETR